MDYGNDTIFITLKIQVNLNGKEIAQKLFV